MGLLRIVRAKTAARRSAWVLMLVSLVVGGGVGGCQGQPKGLPESAVFKKAGYRKVAYTPEREGTVYVVDEWDNTVMYSGPVRQGEEVVVDPVANQVTVGGQAVPTKKVYKNDHAIYFGPAAP